MENLKNHQAISKILTLTGFKTLYDYRHSGDYDKLMKKIKKLMIFSGANMGLGFLLGYFLNDFGSTFDPSFLFFAKKAGLVFSCLGLGGLFAMAIMIVKSADINEAIGTEYKIAHYLSTTSSRDIFWHELKQIPSIASKFDLVELQQKCESILKQSKFNLLLESKESRLYSVLQPVLSALAAVQKESLAVGSTDLFFSDPEIKTMTHNRGS